MLPYRAAYVPNQAGCYRNSGRRSRSMRMMGEPGLKDGDGWSQALEVVQQTKNTPHFVQFSKRKGSAYEP